VNLKINRWTPAEDEQALALRAAGLSWRDMDGRIPNRTWRAVRMRIAHLSGPKAKYESKPKSDEGARADYRRIVSAAHAPRPSEAMIAEARRVAEAPRTLTAWICGDPPPMRSALAQRYLDRQEGV
jgi:hypothetical protein